MSQPSDVGEAITRLAREESGQVLALLAARFRDLDLADESVQDALLEAVEAWKRSGIPDNPPAWLHTVARNKAIDRLRRQSSSRRRLRAAAPDLVAREQEQEPEMIVEYSDIGDEHLRLLLLCCHPALDRDTQIALTLRLAGGLTTTEIAAAFLVPEATLAQRIVRAKRKIRDAGIPLSIPEALDDRVDALLTVLYLIFNEGYLSRGATDEAIRIDLVDEAIRLTIQTHELLPDSAEVEGLLALEMLTRARTDSRIDATGDIVLLEHQDRSRWDLAEIEQANRILVSALARMSPGPFQLQAIIAAHHANAPTAADTDWATIAGTYAQLEMLTGSPIVALNHAVAVSMADGPRAGLARLERITTLDSYHLFHAARAELLARTGETDAAATAFRRARALATNPAEQRHLDRRLTALGT